MPSSSDITDATRLSRYFGVGKCTLTGTNTRCNLYEDAHRRIASRAWRAIPVAATVTSEKARIMVAPAKRPTVIALPRYVMPMEILLFGATGMVGRGVLRECMLDP